jgi:photosystem II stability/assembly factor-like uncharacterized protein
MFSIRRLLLVWGVLCIVGLVWSVPAQLNPDLYQNLRWRCIGPFRGGRTVGATGVPSQPNIFYAGINNGGVWKTDDYGRTWKPIFDDQPTGSIGDIAVSASNPKIIYVGSGEGLQRPDLSVGDGIYKSTDAGKTWRHLGLREGQQVGSIIIDPRDENRVFAALLGHPYGPNEERGVYRSLDGGENWQKILYKDDNTGAIQVSFDPKNSQIIYADLWASRQGPWENGSWQGPGSGLYKSIDGGNTWRQLKNGLPTFDQGLGRIGFSIASSDPNRIYATVDSPKLGGIYRSDDAGESWRRVNEEVRLWGRGSDFAEVKVHPQNPDIVFIANTSTYRSTDGGQTFTAIKGAPGGDDYHRIWFNPNNPDIILMAGDQGVIITVNGGQSWSSWYNQPTAQFYHVVTDNQFPYWVYGGQQESGSAGVASRGDYGAITWRDWQSVGAEEYGYIAPDPLNPNIIYGGKLTRFDRMSGQTQNIAPEAIRSGKYRFLRTAPLIFSPVDPHTLYYGGNVLFHTTDGGYNWAIISPDLSREKPEVPANIGVYRTSELENMPRRGVIYTVAPSFKDLNIIWAGTDDGLIHLTRNGGKTWQNITPPDLSSWSKVSLMEASHFDTETVYAAINRLRLDDLRPHIYRTHDGGKTWIEITKGIPNNEVVNAIREDPVCKGLLFAGTERAVYVSFNDGDEWQSLRLNMPATSIRDLVVHNDDLVVGTHGRSFWILDNITPLRQVDQQVWGAEAFLFKPQVSYRVRRSMNRDTPIPPDEPMGQNPPDGAIIDYFLKTDASEPITLEIFDQSNKLVKRFSSADKAEEIKEKELKISTYWIRLPRILPAKAGMQRFVWDLHYPPPEGVTRDYPISAIYLDTPSMPMGPVVLPDVFTVKLTVNGKTYTQPLIVKIDPRVKTPSEGLTKMFEISMQSYEGMRQVHATLLEVRALRAQLKTLLERIGQGELVEAITLLDKKIASIELSDNQNNNSFVAGKEKGLTDLQKDLSLLMELVESSDTTPTTQVLAASEKLQRTLAELLVRWNEVKNKDLKVLDEQLHRAKLQLRLVQ